MYSFVLSSKSGSEVDTQVLSELFESLDGKISNKMRNKVVEYLKSRIESIGDAKKRENTVSKVSVYPLHTMLSILVID